MPPHFLKTLDDAPVCPQQDHYFEVHGHRLQDPFAWLRADNWKEVLKKPKLLPAPIRAHLKAENAYCEDALKETQALQKLLVKEMRGRMKEDESSLPAPDGPFAYNMRYEEGAEHPQICRRPRAGGAVDILLDVNALSQNSTYFDLGDAAHSPNHQWLAWSFDDKGSEFYTIRIRDLATGRDLSDTLETTDGDVVWSADSSSFYYVEVDDNHRPVRVKRHRLGTPATDDVLIYEEKEEGWFVDLDETQSGAFAVISISDHETSESWLIDRHEAKAMPRLVAARNPELQYEVEHYGDQLIILTNADGAEDFKLVTAPVATPSRAYWQDLVAHRAGTMILGHVCLRSHLIRMERENACPRIVIREWASGDEHSIALDEDAYSIGFDAGYEYDTSTLRFTYSSMTTPAETYDYNLVTRTRTLLKRQEIPSGHDPEVYVTRRIFAVAIDGEEVPISLVHRKDLPLDGSAPCLLYGYGSYGHALSAGFRSNLLSLVDRGFVYAIAHIRGGTEKGWRWYKQGKREHKRNTFTDFIACAETLIAKHYTAPQNIVAHGGSAGGMLMGAVANMRPDLFGAIIADVPFVDVMNTMLDGDLPLTPPEWPEWGNPRANVQDFNTILSYSPYDNIKAQTYPAILALGGLTDPRVTYWEPAKWVAKLRATMTGGGPVLLKTNMEAGHGGVSGRFDQLKEVAFLYAFALASLKVPQA
jgi:oligopeptidase B